MARLVAAFLGEARESLDLALYDVRLPGEPGDVVAGALREATERGEIAVTLTRAVGELSRNDLPERPGHAGWPTATPEAQCLGSFEAEFALMPHGPRDDATIALIERTADDVLLPLVGTTLRSALGMPDPARRPFLMLDGDGLAFSACKESEDGEWIVLRCVNLLDSEVAGSWRLARQYGIREARLARLDETPLEALPMREDGVVRFVASPRGVVTILAR
jgi:alpha-mannosidase